VTAIKLLNRPFDPALANVDGHQFAWTDRWLDVFLPTSPDQHRVRHAFPLCRASFAPTRTNQGSAEINGRRTRRRPSYSFLTSSHCVNDIVYATSDVPKGQLRAAHPERTIETPGSIDPEIAQGTLIAYGEAVDSPSALSNGRFVPDRGKPAFGGGADHLHRLSTISHRPSAISHQHLRPQRAFEGSQHIRHGLEA
jgi:hypothetical protein